MPRNRQPIREQSFRIAVLFVPFALAVTALLLLGQARGPHSGMWSTTSVVTLVVAVSGAIVATIIGTRVGRRLVGDRMEVALRERGANKWRHGRLTISPGALSFQPYPLHMRIPNGEPVEMRVNRLGPDSGRRPSLRQIWSINPQLHIIDLDTDRGSKELAALPSRISELRERLGQ